MRACASERMSPQIIWVCAGFTVYLVRETLTSLRTSQQTLTLLSPLTRWVLNFKFVISSVRNVGSSDGDGTSGHSASDDIDVGADVSDISATRRGVRHSDSVGNDAMLAASDTIEELGWGLPLVVLPRTPQPQPLVRAIRIQY